MEKTLCAIELYDIKKKKKSLQKLKDWIKISIPKISNLYKFFIYDDKDLKAHIDFLDARKQIQDMKKHYYERMNDDNIDTKSIEEIYDEIDFEISIIDHRIKEIELYQDTLEKQSITDNNR